MTCYSQRKSSSLQVIFISAGPDSTNPNKQAMSIDLIANLWNEKLKDTEFFTIGSTNVPNADLQSNSPLLKYRNKLTGNTNTMLSFLTRGNTANTLL